MHSAIDILKAYVTGQAEIGYTKFKPGPKKDDVILVTFPKSGSTWISYILHQLRSKCDDTFKDIKDVVIDITPGHWDPEINPFLIDQEYTPRTYKTHGSYKLCPKGGKYIYVARDPKDSLWSLYNFIHDLFGLEEYISISEFYEKMYVTRFGTNHDIGNIWNHLLGWYPHKNDKNVLWMHYEDLIADRTYCTIAMAQHMNINPDSYLIQNVVKNSEMSHMKKIQSKINPSQENRVGKIVLGFGAEMNNYAKKMKYGKMRKGVIGDGTGNLPLNILNQLEYEWNKRITPVLGFKNYEEMRKESSLLNKL